MTYLSSTPTHNAYRAARRELWPAFVGVGTFSAILNILMLTGSIYMLQVYDRVLGSGSLPTLVGLFIIVVILYGFLGLYDALRGRLLNRISLRLDQKLSERAFAAHLRAGQGGDEQPLLDLDSLRGFISSPIMTGLFDLPFVPLFLGVLTLLHPWLGVLTLIGAGIVAMIAFTTRIITRKSESSQLSLEYAARQIAQIGQSGADTVTSMGMESRITGRWQGIRTRSLAEAQRTGDPASILAAVSRSTRMLLQSAILTLGALLTLRGEISSGMIVASSVLSGRALAPVDQAIGQWRQIGRALAAHQRLETFFGQTPIERTHTQLSAPTGAILVKGLSKLGPLRAGTNRAQILSRIDFTLAPGDGVGVLGHSASGKSSLARLLVGTDRPDFGEIRLDGATLDQWSPTDLGRHIGYLPQTPCLLPGTLRENIARFDSEAKDADVIMVAQLTGIHQMIVSLPQGYDTPVGGAADSVQLSGGQLQRIGLARAIFGLPPIVVLDEPNAHLDAAGEAALTKTILTLRAAGSTVIVMAHRPSALEAVNKILILDQGQIRKFGPKEEVMSRPVAPVTKIGDAAPPPVANPVMAPAARPDFQSSRVGALISAARRYPLDDRSVHNLHKLFQDLPAQTETTDITLRQQANV